MDRNFWYSLVKKTEKNAAKLYDLILACAESDASYFQSFNANVTTLPNGMNPLRTSLEDDRKARKSLGQQDVRLSVLFVGSAYQPNRDALDTICKFAKTYEDKFRGLRN